MRNLRSETGGVARMECSKMVAIRELVKNIVRIRAIESDSPHLVDLMRAWMDFAANP